MRLRFGMIAEFATIVPAYTIVGVRDLWTWTGDDMPVYPLPEHYLALSFGADTSEEGKHAVDVRIVNEDGMVVFQVPPFEASFTQQRPGYEMVHNVVLQLRSMTIPALGTYVWEILAGGKRIGEIPFYLRRAEEKAGDLRPNL